ncbi:MAG TPA: CocE/NonD family hydrolase [Terriglobia bacterium]|nr:CocE/NonD family hydrolase [Terriglobia bacterium]
MSDGVRLAASLFMPGGAKPGGRFPAILEYLPYRKDDWSVERDLRLHSYTVRRGYVVARVDIRGTGQSEGRPPDREYSEKEQLDGLQVIDWLSRQSWSSGAVGMMGISWGGFNSIQLAARHPPALKAIIAADATEELFHDDIHTIDGMMHADEFELSMDLQEMLTRAPDFPTDEQSLAPRFDNPPWFLLYLHEQRDGPFWRRASLDPHYERLQIPVFMIGGFLDGYRDSIPRFFEHVQAPVKALVGPWNHSYPHDAAPGPAIEWRDEAVRWWDHWLKGINNGIMDEPRLIVYMRHAYAPGIDTAEIPGEWRNEPGWPPPELKPETLYLEPDHTLGPTSPAVVRQELGYAPSAGAEAGFWWGDLTPDQRPTDAYSLAYDSAPFSQPVAILGLPRAFLRASATAPLADWFVRLSDVAPDGAATLITGGGLNGAQRNSASRPADLEAGKVYSLAVPLHFTSWVFPAGHRIRVAVSNALWPMIWPTPFTMTTRLELGGADGSRIELPVVPVESALPASRFKTPAPPEPIPGVRSGGATWPGPWFIHRDVAGRSTQVDWRGDDWSQFPWGREADHEQMTYKVQDDHPERSSVEGVAWTRVDLKGRNLLWRVDLALSSDAQQFHYKFTRTLTEKGKLVRKKTWQADIARDYQ